MRRKLFFIAFALLVGSAAFAQTAEEATNTFNEGVELSKTNVAEAIVKFEKAIEIASQVGEEADEVKNQIVAILPNLYLKKAVDLLGEEKYTEAIAAYEETIKCAEKYSNEDIAGKSKDAIGKVYYAQARIAIRDKKADEAIALLDKAIEVNPGNDDATFLKGEALRGSGKFDESIAIYDELLKKATEAENEDDIAKMKKSLGAAYLAKSLVPLREKKYAEAQPLLEKCVEYGDNPTAYTQLASVYNTRKLHDKTIVAATKALELRKSETADKKASLNFFLGSAYQAKANNEKACAALKNALFPPYTESAKYKIETELKCK